MYKLPNFNDFIEESNTLFSFNGDDIKLGSNIISVDGTSGIIISKNSNEGIVTYKDSNGCTWVSNPEELMITKNNKTVFESLDPSVEILPKEQWYNIIKFLITLDILKGNGPGGAILNIGEVFPKWRVKIENLLSLDFKKDLMTKAQSDKIIDKIYHNSNITSILNQLILYPYTNLELKRNFIKKREFNRLKEINNKRKELIKNLSQEVWSSLDPTEKSFLFKVTSHFKKSVNEYSPTIGTGTYTATSSDQNYMTPGYTNSKDSSSGGTQII